MPSVYSAWAWVSNLQVARQLVVDPCREGDYLPELARYIVLDPVRAETVRKHPHRLKEVGDHLGLCFVTISIITKHVDKRRRF